MPRGSTDTVGVDDPKVAEAVRYIRARFRSNIGALDVAAAVGLPRRSLDRRFRLALGRTVHDELSRNRLEHCKSALARTAQPIKRIAMDSGYRSIEHFSRLFRRAVGMTPGTYRASHGPGADTALEHRARKPI